MDHENWLETADFYVAGFLEPDELAEFEAHLAAGCLQCHTHIRETQEAIAAIPASLETISPAPAVKQRLLEWVDLEKAGLVFINADEGAWIEAEPGIFAKILRMGPARGLLTARVRLAPGSRYAAHRHLGSEEVLVLEGSCYCGGRLLRQGDYHCAEIRRRHGGDRAHGGRRAL